MILHPKAFAISSKVWNEFKERSKTVGKLCKFCKKLKYKLIKDNRVALIKLEGIIIDSNIAPVASKLIECFDQVKKQNIKAVVFRINSPGGTVGASQEIYSAIKKLQDKEDVKVVASFGDISASGGVYVGVAADKIIANPGTITGSIGVIIKMGIIKDLYKKIGIDHEVIKSGEFKDILSNTKHLSDKDKEVLQSMIDSTYEEFVNVVAKERNLEVDIVKQFADGRIFTGRQAKELGLIDEIGTQKDAIDLAIELAKIEGEPNIVEITPKKTFMQKITGASVKEFFENANLNSLYNGVPLWMMERR